MYTISLIKFNKNKFKMKIAILISGHCRTFVYEEQRIFFEKFIKYLNKFGQCDTYLMLKTDQMMQTDQGIIQLEKIIKMLIRLLTYRQKSNIHILYLL